jgi:hypothetical protein
MTRFWPGGTPIGVATDARGQIRALRWGGRTHRVATVVARWRLDLAWRGAPVRRDYAALLTHSGMLLVLFRDRQGGGWFLQRLYD